MSEIENPNPVFGYRAGFRRSAKRVQSVLLFSGLLCSLGFAPGLVLGEPRVGLCVSGIGIVLIVCGVLWGFFWRGQLRDEFRSTFTPKP